MLGSLDIGLVGVGASFADGYITDVTTPSDPGPGDFDLGDNALVLDQGVLNLSGTVLGSFVDETFDLASEPIVFVVPSPVPGEISGNLILEYLAIQESAGAATDAKVLAGMSIHRLGSRTPPESVIIIDDFQWI